MISGIGAISPQAPTVGGGNATSLFSSGLASKIGGESDIGSSFAAMLSQAAGHAVGTLQQAETMSVKALQGDADMRQVVDSVMSAEQSLQAAIAIRDKIVTAYLEISRMSI